MLMTHRSPAHSPPLLLRPATFLCSSPSISHVIFLTVTSDRLLVVFWTALLSYRALLLPTRPIKGPPPSLYNHPVSYIYGRSPFIHYAVYTPTRRIVGVRKVYAERVHSYRTAAQSYGGKPTLYIIILLMENVLVAPGVSEPCQDVLSP
jgi:hypothetical protein